MSENKIHKKYNPGNNSTTVEYSNTDNKLHRLDGPAVIVYYGSETDKIRMEEYYIDGNLHREDGPAYILYNEDGTIIEKEYYLWTPGQGSGNTVLTENQFLAWSLNKLLKPYDLIINNRLQIHNVFGKLIVDCTVENLEQTVKELILVD